MTKAKLKYIDSDDRALSDDFELRSDGSSGAYWKNTLILERIDGGQYYSVAIDSSSNKVLIYWAKPRVFDLESTR